MQYFGRPVQNILGLLPPRFELRTFCVRGRRDSRYTTEATIAKHWWIVEIFVTEAYSHSNFWVKSWAIHFSVTFFNAFNFYSNFQFNNKGSTNPPMLNWFFFLPWQMFRGLLFRTLTRVDPVLRYLWLRPILPNNISFKIVLHLGAKDCFTGILGWKNSTSTNKI